MTTTNRLAYCYAPSCSRVASSFEEGLCLMHALERGRVIACARCGHNFRLIAHFPRVACECIA